MALGAFVGLVGFSRAFDELLSIAMLARLTVGAFSSLVRRTPFRGLALRHG